MILHVEDGRIAWLATLVEPTSALGWLIPSEYAFGR